MEGHTHIHTFIYNQATWPIDRHTDTHRQTDKQRKPINSKRKKKKN